MCALYPSETGDIVIRRVTQMLGIRRVTTCKRKRERIIYYSHCKTGWE